MKTTKPSEIIRMDKQALRTFAGFSFIVYAPLAYCYYTAHFLEMKIIAAVILVLGILIVNIYSSFKSNERKKKPNTVKERTLGTLYRG